MRQSLNAPPMATDLCQNIVIYSPPSTFETLVQIEELDELGNRSTAIKAVKIRCW
jgi:hypothetical protein